MPEIAPSPDFGANIERAFVERSSVLQAWGTYGILWPVVHQQLGVAPDLGNRRLAVVPQLPPGHTSASGSNIRVGSGSVGARVSLVGNRLLVRVRVQKVSAALTLGAVLPSGSEVSSVELDGDRAPYTLASTTRGDEARVNGHPGTNELVITLR